MRGATGNLCEQDMCDREKLIEAVAKVPNQRARGTPNSGYSVLP